MKKDIFNRKWILDNSLEIIGKFEKGMLTIRALHYQLVAIGMTNSLTHYKRVVAAMGQARWDGMVDFDTFADHDRETIGTTHSERTDVESATDKAKEQVEAWLHFYSKNRWENQPIYPEVFIEKKALQGVFERPCRNFDVALAPCKGYPSLTFLHEAAQRFLRAESNGKKVVILYFGDYDPSGEDIPRAVEQNLKDLGCHAIEVQRIALLKHQVVEWKLPPAPVKEGDSRSVNWDGLGQVELDAVAPNKLQSMCTTAIESVFNSQLYKELLAQEEVEREQYQSELRDFVSNL